MIFFYFFKIKQAAIHYLKFGYIEEFFFIFFYKLHNMYLLVLRR